MNLEQRAGPLQEQAANGNEVQAGEFSVNHV